MLADETRRIATEFVESMEDIEKGNGLWFHSLIEKMKRAFVAD